MDACIRILFLAADPSDLTRTRLAAEYQVIRNELEKGKLARRFELHPEFSVKVSDMTRAVLNLRPHIVQFSGHGSMSGDLCFEEPAATAKRVKPENLAGFFALLAGRVDCVVLNACYSDQQAALIAKYIPFVVGWTEVLTEKAAICFSRGFYQSLSAGEKIAGAFNVARALLQAEELLGQAEPVLKVGPGAAEPLAGPWGDSMESDVPAPGSQPADGNKAGTQTGVNFNAKRDLIVNGGVHIRPGTPPRRAREPPGSRKGYG